MLRTSSAKIRNYTDSERETATGGNFRLSTAVSWHIRTAQVIPQPQRLHSQLVGFVTAVMYQVAGLTCSFVYGMGLQPDGIIHYNLASDAHHLLFSHVRPTNQSTITVCTYAIKRLDALGSLTHVSPDINNLHHFITRNSILNATQ